MSGRRLCAPICTLDDCDSQHDLIIHIQEGSEFLAHSAHFEDNMLQGPYGFNPSSIPTVIQLLKRDLEREDPLFIQLFIEVCHPRSDSLDWIHDVSSSDMKHISQYGIKYKMYNILELCVIYFLERAEDEPLFTFGFAIKLGDDEFANEVVPLTLGFEQSEIRKALGGKREHHDYFAEWKRYNAAAKGIIKRTNPPEPRDHLELEKKDMKNYNSKIVRELRKSPRYLFSEKWKTQEMDELSLELDGCLGCLGVYERWFVGMRKAILEIPPLESTTQRMDGLTLGIDSWYDQIGRKGL